MTPRETVARFADPYRVNDGTRFRLKDFDPGDTRNLESKSAAKELLQDGVKVLCELQETLYAQDRWALLLIFQAMDAAGKDGTIAHVMSGINPTGCQVSSFKAPSVTELNHDFLWRTTCQLPERGRIGIFNRSYYEEVLAVRVHPEILARQRLPRRLVTKKIWKERFEDINSFERYLGRNGVMVRKFFLNISKDEQKRRFLSRLKENEKNWKFSPADVNERAHWDQYMEAYEATIRHTSTEAAPWYVVPADNKWYTRLVVATAIIEALDSLHLKFPAVDKAMRKELDAARALLAKEK
jgi:PPK2 family polyphosphate:nucleotide phosphotransferase